jgi:hypothetical protein
MKVKISVYIYLLFYSAGSLLAQDSVFFFEHFDDTGFAQRGWYDNLKGTLSTEEHIPGSKSSLECKFLKGGRTPDGGTPGRHMFAETDEVCLTFWVKYSPNYIGSGKPYHPHEFSFVTNKDNKWVGPAFTHLTTYIEHNEGVPLLAIQDGENIDQKLIGANLVGLTEDRSVAGCNGSKDGYQGDCYRSGNVYVNGKQWKAAYRYFSESPGKYYKNDWHKIEAYFKLNSIANGVSKTDGILQYWYDGELMIDHNDIEFRTGKHPDMMFNQFLIVPYIGDGSPVEQIMWIDNLTVSKRRLNFSDVGQHHSFSDISITPNPASDYIEISGSSVILSEAKDLGVSIYDVLGVEVYCSIATPPVHIALRYSPSQEGGKTRFDVSHLSPGVYFVRVGNFVRKFVKM